MRLAESPQPGPAPSPALESLFPPLSFFSSASPRFDLSPLTQHIHRMLQSGITGPEIEKQFSDFLMEHYSSDPAKLDAVFDFASQLGRLIQDVGRQGPVPASLEKTSTGYQVKTKLTHLLHQGFFFNESTGYELGDPGFNSVFSSGSPDFFDASQVIRSPETRPDKLNAPPGSGRGTRAIQDLATILNDRRLFDNAEQVKDILNRWHGFAQASEESQRILSGLGASPSLSALRNAFGSNRAYLENLLLDTAPGAIALAFGQAGEQLRTDLAYSRFLAAATEAYGASAPGWLASERDASVGNLIGDGANLFASSRARVSLANVFVQEALSAMFSENSNISNTVGYAWDYDDGGFLRLSLSMGASHLGIVLPNTGLGLNLDMSSNELLFMSPSTILINYAQKIPLGKLAGGQLNLSIRGGVGLFPMEDKQSDVELGSREGLGAYVQPHSSPVLGYLTSEVNYRRESKSALLDVSATVYPLSPGLTGWAASAYSRSFGDGSTDRVLRAASRRAPQLKQYEPSVVLTSSAAWKPLQSVVLGVSNDLNVNALTPTRLSAYLHVDPFRKNPTSPDLLDAVSGDLPLRFKFSAGMEGPFGLSTPYVTASVENLFSMLQIQYARHFGLNVPFNSLKLGISFGMDF